MESDWGTKGAGEGDATYQKKELWEIGAGKPS